MSNEIAKKKFELSYKGIENFLRRIAFNLGNSPSKTDVKLISCVRVDLADLQQKIICLEQELRSTKGRCKNTPTVRTALCEIPFRPGTPQAVSICDKTLDEDLIKQNQERTNILDSEISDALQTHSHFNTSESNYQKENKDQTEKIDTATMYLQPENLKKNKNIAEKVNPQRRCKKKKKKYNYNKKSKQQLIYYAHTTGFPRHRCSFYKHLPFDKNKLLDRNFATDMHYKHQTKNSHKSNSEFSSPICRDVDKSYPGTSSFDTDICSCCHGMFRNIDRELTTQNRINLLDKAMINTQGQCKDKRKEYYNSKFYDLVPVKEKSTMHNNSRKTGRERENKVYYTEKVYGKSYLHDYINVRPTQIDCFRKSSMQNDDFITASCCKKRIYKHKVRSEPTKKTLIFSSCPADKPVSHIQQKTVNLSTQKNVECFTHSLNNAECQTVATKSVQLDPTTTNDKTITELTLNQIKSILQSMLYEVKTTAITQNKNKSKKDIYVQKGSSQNTFMNSSQFVKSFTYSPYNLDSYISPLSGQLSPGTIYSPMEFQFQYLQNNPVLVHPLHKVNRESIKKPYVTRSVCTINPVEATTNTESEKNKKEVNNIPKENLTISHNGVIQEAFNTTCSSPQNRSTDETNIISNKNYNEFHSNSTTDSHLEDKNYNKTCRSKFKVITPSLRKVMSKDRNYEDEAISLKQFKYNSNLTMYSKSAGDKKETEDETAAVVPQAITKKSGMFRKMLSSVRKFNAKDGNLKILINRFNDSPEKYQEGFGNKALGEKCSPKNHKVTTKREPNYNSNKIGGYPNMEQEYRRSWEENLTFHSETPRRGNSSFEKSSCFQLHRHPKLKQDSEDGIQDISTQNSANKIAKDKPDTKLSWWKKQSLSKSKHISDLKH